MNDQVYEQLRQQVRRLKAETVLAVASRCDGHTIFKPKAFLDAGLPEPVVEHFTRKYRSDGSPKGTLFVDGAAVEELTGVYGLDVLRFMVHALDVPYRRAMGRGFEAQNIRTALREYLEPRLGRDVPAGA